MSTVLRTREADERFGRSSKRKTEERDRSEVEATGADETRVKSNRTGSSSPMTNGAADARRIRVIYGSRFLASVRGYRGGRMWVSWPGRVAFDRVRVGTRPIEKSRDRG